MQHEAVSLSRAHHYWYVHFLFRLTIHLMSPYLSLLIEFSLVTHAKSTIHVPANSTIIEIQSQFDSAQDGDAVEFDGSQYILVYLFICIFRFSCIDILLLSCEFN